MELNEVTYEVLATGDKMPSGYYLKADVDAIIAQKDFEIDRLKEFNAFLKQRNSNGDVDCLILLDDLEQKDKEIAELKKERRWRKFSDERPKDKQWIFVFVENPSKYGTYIELRRWDMGCKFDVEEQELYTLWMPLPSAPKEVQDEV